MALHAPLIWTYRPSLHGYVPVIEMVFFSYYYQVSDATASAAKEALGSPQRLVEVTALIGGYNMVSRFLEALKLTPETSTDLPPMPQDGVV
jgi:hypothetical protein